MEEILAEVEVFDIIVIREPTEQVDLRLDQEVMAALDPAQVFEQLLAPGVLDHSLGVFVVCFGGLLRFQGGLEELEYGALRIQRGLRPGQDRFLGNLERNSRKALGMEPLQDLAVLLVLQDEELQLLLEQDVLDPRQEAGVKIRRLDFRPDGDGQDLIRPQLRV